MRCRRLLNLWVQAHHSDDGSLCDALHCPWMTKVPPWKRGLRKCSGRNLNGRAEREKRLRAASRFVRALSI